MVNCVDLQKQQILAAILKPLLLISNPRDRLIFVGKHYFGMSTVELCNTFGLRKRMILYILRSCDNVLKTITGDNIKKEIESDDSYVPSFDIFAE